MSNGTEESAVVDDVKVDQTIKKRKRSKDTTEQDELEIDVNLPEPASKKAKRKEKKAAASKPSKVSTLSSNGNSTSTSKDPSDLVPAATTTTTTTTTTPNAAGRSEWGIWIGNLPFTATNQSLRDFLQDKAPITGYEILRLHLPTPREGSGPQVKNRGFAYIDFTTKEIMDKAIGLSETLIAGRRCLIKDAKSFEGRPAKPAAGEDAGNDAGRKGKEPSKRVFVGNLGFDVSREEMREFLGQAPGGVEDVFLATFEDSGKCKGFGWVTFATLEGAEAAVKGYFYRDKTAGDGTSDASSEEDKGGDGNDSDVEIVVEKQESNKVKKSKREKRWINRLGGRTLRCEFAEDATTRYKKRYGKDRDGGGKDDARPRFSRASPTYEPMGDAAAAAAVGGVTNDKTEGRRKLEKSDSKSRSKPDKEDRREERRKRHDARTIAPGQALASTQRASGAIVEGKGKKVSFD